MKRSLIAAALILAGAGTANAHSWGDGSYRSGYGHDRSYHRDGYLSPWQRWRLQWWRQHRTSRYHSHGGHDRDRGHHNYRRDDRRDRDYGGRWNRWW